MSLYMFAPPFFCNDAFNMTGQFLDLFALDEDVAVLESKLLDTQHKDRMLAVVAMAWHLRQRDCMRALELADEADTLLRAAEIDKLEWARNKARVMLVRAEVKALFADLEGAERQVNAAIAAFEASGDRNGAGDGRWLLASIWHDRGNRQQVDVCLRQALED
jgi:hypothetical protein